MKNNIPDELIAKYLMGECSTKEIDRLEEWKMADPKNIEEFNRMQEIMNEATPDAYEPDIEKALNKVSQKLPSQHTKKPVWKYYGLRIASVFIIGLSILGIVRLVNVNNEIIITSQIGELPKEIVLPDGSEVTLNESSEIKYTKKFKGPERKVSFEGEAYFKIARNEEKPFVIESRNTTTKVLGTEFNLIAKKADTLVKIFVTEGLVSFNLNEASETQEVKVAAGQTGEINTSKGIITSKVNKDLNFLAWKNGKLTFDNQEFGMAIKTISSFYNEKLIVEGADLDTAIFVATFDSLEFEEVLSTIELIMDVNIVKDDDTFIIKEKL